MVVAGLRPNPILKNLGLIIGWGQSVRARTWHAVWARARWWWLLV